MKLRKSFIYLYKNKIIFKKKKKIKVIQVKWEIDKIHFKTKPIKKVNQNCF